MRRRFSILLLGYLLAAFVLPVRAQDELPPETLSPWGDQGGETLPPLSQADAAVLDEIVSRYEVATTPESPRLSRYVLDFATAILQAAGELLMAFMPGLADYLGAATPMVARVIFFIAAVLLLLFLYRLVRAMYRHRPAGEDVEALDEAEEEPAAGVGPEAWAEELRRRLTAGDAVAACEALWWWLAQSITTPAIVAGGGVEDSWTSRELLDRAGRRDLTVPVRRLDRMIYGARRPGANDVRQLWQELEENLG